MAHTQLPAALILGLLSTLPSAAQEKFEAASVRMTPPDKIGLSTISPYGGTTYSVTNISLEFLVTSPTQ